MSNIREMYKIQKTTIQEAYERQMILKLNKEYEENVNKACITIVEYFKELYPNVPIDKPRAREKSAKSLMGKIKNLQIERLSKLYVLGKIKENEKGELFELLKERVREREELNDNVLEDIEELIYTNIENMDISKFIKEVIQTQLSPSTKTALLRILKSKIEKSNLIDKEKILQYLENQYGKAKALLTGIQEYDLLRSESIEQLEKDATKLANIENAQEYLKSKDLRGMKIVIGSLPKDFETNNERIKELLEKREKSTTQELKQKYDGEAIIELSKEFVDRLSKSAQVLKKMNVDVIKDSKKHKNKKNGYIADHIKFQVKEKKEQTFELQVKSSYIEEIAIGEGEAAHTNRPGKSRVIPNISYGINFIKELQYVLPKYTFLVEKDGKYTTRKCSLLENTMLFFRKQLKPNTKQYDEIKNIILQYEDEKQAVI